MCPGVHTGKLHPHSIQVFYTFLSKNVTWYSSSDTLLSLACSNSLRKGMFSDRISLVSLFSLEFFNLTFELIPGASHNSVAKTLKKSLNWNNLTNEYLKRALISRQCSYMSSSNLQNLSPWLTGRIFNSIRSHFQVIKRACFCAR